MCNLQLTSAFSMLTSWVSASVRDSEVKAIGLPFLIKQVPRSCLLESPWTMMGRSQVVLQKSAVCLADECFQLFQCCICVMNPVK